MTDLNVVIIEDNADLAYMLAYILHYDLPEAHVTTITSNFDQVFTNQTWENVDVAVVDVLLPDVDGRDILMWLAREKPGVRRVAWTALDPYLVQDERTGMIADVVVQKPSQPTLVIDAIRGATDRHG